MTMLMMMMGEEEGKGGKVMAMATRVACKQMAMPMKGVISIKTKEAGKEEVDGKGSKRDGNGMDSGNGKQRGQKSQQRQQ